MSVSYQKQSGEYETSDSVESARLAGPRFQLKRELAGRSYAEQLELVRPAQVKVTASSKSGTVQRSDGPEPDSAVRGAMRLEITMPDFLVAGRPPKTVEIDLASSEVADNIHEFVDYSDETVDHLTGRVQVLSASQYTALIIGRVGLVEASSELVGTIRVDDPLSAASSTVTRARALRSFTTWARHFERTLNEVARYQSNVEEIVEADGSVTIRDVLSPEIADRTFEVLGGACEIVADRELIVAYLDDVATYLEALEFGTDGHQREVRSHRQFLSTLCNSIFLTHGDVRAYLNARRNALLAVDAIADEPFASRNRQGCVTDVSDEGGGLTREQRADLFAGTVAVVSDANNAFEMAVDDAKREWQTDSGLNATFAKMIVDIAAELISPRLGSAIVELIGRVGLNSTANLDAVRLTQRHARGVVKQLAAWGRSSVHDYIDAAQDWDDEEKRWVDMLDAFNQGNTAIWNYVERHRYDSCALPDEEILIYRANLEQLKRDDYAAQILMTLERYEEQVGAIPRTGQNLPWAYWIDLSEFGVRPRLALLSVGITSADKLFVRWVDRDMEDQALARMEATGREIEIRRPEEVLGIGPLPPAEQSYASGS